MHHTAPYKHHEAAYKNIHSNFFKPFSLSRSSLWTPKSCFNAKRGEVRAVAGSAQAMLAILMQDWELT